MEDNNKTKEKENEVKAEERKNSFIYDDSDAGEIPLLEYAKVEILCNTVVPKGAMQRPAHFKSIEEKTEYDENVKKLINDEIKKIKQSKSKEDIKLSKDIYHVEKISKEENGTVKNGVRFVSSINKKDDDLMEMTSVALLFDVPDSQGWIVKDRDIVVEASKNFLRYGDKKLKFTHEKDEYGFPFEIDANTIEVYLAKETDEYFGDIPNSLIFVTKFNDKNMWDFVKNNNWETSIELWAIEKNYKEKKKNIDMDKNNINSNTEEEKNMLNKMFNGFYSTLIDFFNKKNVKENNNKKEDKNMEEKDTIEALKQIVEEVKSLKETVEKLKEINDKKENDADLNAKEEKKKEEKAKEDESNDAELKQKQKEKEKENAELKEKLDEIEKIVKQIDLNHSGQVQAEKGSNTVKSGFSVNYNSRV